MRQKELIAEIRRLVTKLQHAIENGTVDIDTLLSPCKQTTIFIQGMEHAKNSLLKCRSPLSPTSKSIKVIEREISIVHAMGMPNDP